MAIATMTAGTAALVSAGVAAAGTAASVGMNLSEAAKQKKAQAKAEQAAGEAVKKAEAEYGKEFLAGVQLPTEAYDRALREGTAQQMQSIQALQEADARTLAAGVGKVQAQATDAQTQARDQMAQDMYNLELAQAKEKSANSASIANLNLDKAAGAQMAAADAEAARASANAGVGSAIVSLGGQMLSAAPLYGKASTPAGVGSFSSNPANYLPSNTSGMQSNLPSAYNASQVSGLTTPSALASGFDYTKMPGLQSPYTYNPINLSK